MSKRFDIVGSLLRPSELLTYKREIEAREDITYPFYTDFEGYEEVESKAIKDVVLKQIDQGIEVISDGEFSKSVWHLDFLWGLGGIKRYIAERGTVFREKDGSKAFETRRDAGIKVVDRLTGKNHHFVDIFKKIKQIATDQPIKICIPSPSHVYFDFIWSANLDYHEVYSSEATLKQDLLQAYKEFVLEYAEAGGTIIQLDDCRWAMFADDNPASPFKDRTDIDTVALATEFVAINNELIAYAKEQGLKVWTHNCRGNYRSRHMSTGSYEKIADLFLGQQQYDRFFLEWDDERAGSLKALEVFKDKDTEVVLGLLSSKTSTLEDEARILDALNEACKMIPKERLYLSHQCGFASTDHGNELTEAQQWDKITQGQKIAQQFWGE
ncbi:MAG: cobalamin-independent methionine synthase II family protein [Defluviitaleaceae bacterium]|nr:cobalamin-independent methionine synthase II family protein [Defluviitaleaceae bacterium]